MRITLANDLQYIYLSIFYTLTHFPVFFFNKKNDSRYAGGVVVLNAISAVFTNQYIMCAFHYGMKVRTACCALVYRKVSEF